MKLNLAETFTSVQGEGCLTGKRMFFIRFGGCSVSICPLHPSHGGLCDENWRSRSVIKDPEGFDHLVYSAADQIECGGWVCITGGEPTDQPDALAYLTSELQRRGLRVNIQTSGTRLVQSAWDWLTVSPKCRPDALAQTHGNELKLVYMGQSMDELAEYQEATRFWHYQLQPLWNGDSCTNMKETVAAIHEAAECGMQWDLSLQAHKFMGVK